MATCAIPLRDKRAVAQKVGAHLTRLYGKRRSYSPPLIKAAMRRCAFPSDWDCWALSLYAAADDFASYHTAIGETCDYAAMQAEMLSSVDSGSTLDFLSADAFSGADTSILDSSPIDPS